jgi:ABC-type branched-subunit amino acid transport system substrate-binding protein/outer membrane protein assembly factor BamD (BamD/ComL family)
MKLFWIVLMLFSAAPFGATAQTTDKPEQELLDRAQKYVEREDLDRAAQTFNQFLTEHPDSSLNDRAWFGLAQVYQRKRDFARAAEQYQALLQKRPDSRLVETARHELALCWIELERPDRALPLLDRERYLATDPIRKREINRLMRDQYARIREPLKVVETLLLERDWVEEPERAALEEQVRRVIETVGERDLMRLMAASPNGFPGDTAQLRLADLYAKRTDFFREERELKRFLKAYPSHPEIGRVRSRLSDIRQDLLEAQPLVAALLPMSGPLQEYGEQVLNGIQMAFEAAAAEGNKVGLVIRDSESFSNRVGSQFEEVVKEMRPVAVIGPLLSREVAGLAAKAERWKVPVVTPTATAPDLVTGKYIVQLAMTRRQQAEGAAEYAMTALGLKRFAVLYPADPYGADLVNLFSLTVARLGGEVIYSEGYPPDAKDFGSTIQHLVQTDLTRYGVMEPPVDEKSEPVYRPGFEAVFLPGDGLQAGLLAAQLAFHDVKPVLLLGAGGWNSPLLLQSGGRFLEGAIFVDGFFGDSTDPAVRSFASAYRMRYQSEPTLFSAQAFDAARLILNAIQQKANSGETVLAHLSGLQDFVGASGYYQKQSSGGFSKRLFVVQVRNGRFVQLVSQNPPAVPSH